MQYKDRCIIPSFVGIQVRECSLGINITDACMILLGDAHVILARQQEYNVSTIPELIYSSTENPIQSLVSV